MTALLSDGEAIALNVTGRISLDGAPEEPCQARITGLDSILFSTKTGPRTGQAALCDLDNIGVVSGRVGPPRGTGFHLVPDLCAARRERLAARLAWLARPNADEREQRNSVRIVPLHRAVTLRLSDGLSLEGEIEDLSKSGALIGVTPRDADNHFFPPGTRVTVGKRYAVIIRSDAGSIAVRFLLPFTDVTFNPSVVL